MSVVSLPRRWAALVVLLAPLGAIANAGQGSKPPSDRPCDQKGGTAVAKAGDPLCGLDNLTMIDYSRYEHLAAFTGTLVDLERSPDCQGADCFGYPQLLVKVNFSSALNVTGTVLVDLVLPGAHSGPSDSLRVGDSVAIVVSEEQPPKEWSCGRLRPCASRPGKILRGIEVFKLARWP